MTESTVNTAVHQFRHQTGRAIERGQEALAFFTREHDRHLADLAGAGEITEVAQVAAEGFPQQQDQRIQRLLLGGSRNALAGHQCGKKIPDISSGGRFHGRR